LEPQIIGVPPQAWWRDALDRIQRMYAAPDIRLAAGHKVGVADGATSATLASGDPMTTSVIGCGANLSCSLGNQMVVVRQPAE